MGAVAHRHRPEGADKKEIGYHAVYYHYRKWCRDGSLERMFAHSIVSIQQQIATHHLNLDGSHVLAKKDGEAVAYQGRKKAKCPSPTQLRNRFLVRERVDAGVLAPDPYDGMAVGRGCELYFPDEGSMIEDRLTVMIPRTQYQAFHGSDVLKQAVVARLKQLLDEQTIEQGHAANSDGSRALISEMLAYHHDRYETFSQALDFPRWVSTFYEAMFESLSVKASNQWAVDFLQAIPIGSNLDDLKQALYKGLLIDPEIGIKNIRSASPEFVQLVEEFERGFFPFLIAEDYLIFADEAWKKDIEEKIDLLANSNNIDFHVHCGLLMLGWMLIDKPIQAIVTCVSAHTALLPWSTAWIHKLRFGAADLGPALPTIAGGLGYAWMHEIELHYDKIARFIVNETKHMLHEAIATKSHSIPLEELQRLHGSVRYLKLEDADRDNAVLRKVALPYPHSISFPKLRDRLVRHIFLRISGLLLVTIAWIGIIICSLILIQPDSFQFDVHFSGLLRLFTFVVLLLGSRALLTLGRRRFPGDGWYQYLKDPHNAILYLRSFQDDSYIEFKQDRNPTLSLLIPGLNAEEEMVRALAGLGNVIAVGDSRFGGMRGAARIKLGDDVWQHYVIEYMQQAKLVVLFVGYGQSIRSELSWARQLLDPQKVLIHVPAHRWREFVRYDEDGEVRSADTFLSEILSVYLGTQFDASKIRHTSHFLWCRPGWKIKPLMSYDEPTNWIFGGHATRYREELRPIYRKFGAGAANEDR
ncbi:MAG: hypothetical protein HY862_13955 [Chloroflexi bacterium]|nr:hypothetical protein [Chloroflexota bacterium]